MFSAFIIKAKIGENEPETEGVSSNYEQVIFDDGIHSQANATSTTYPTKTF
jgi:hypothetical protein